MVMASTVILLSLILIVSAIGAVAVVRSLNQTSRDRDSARAFEASDAAMDVIEWRMNKQLLGIQLGNLNGILADPLAVLGCGLEADALGVISISATISSGADCTYTVGNVGRNGLSAECSNDIGIEVLPGGLDLNQLPAIGSDGRLLSRDLVCYSTVNGVTRRVYARLDLELVADLGAGLAAPTSLWTRSAWYECAADLNAACPPASAT